ncbi:MAG TPA: ATP-binding protein, partial [Candidatus Acidoferrales bacterium]|nr:ATP-binding protein [Candidatus Acidoferrales bacterium]
KQLLGITRQQPIVLKAVSLSACVKRAHQLMEQSLGEDYRLVVLLDDKLPPVCADECNMEQVLINLVLNARDAMAGGGDITIDAQPVDLTDTYILRRGGTKMNEFVRLTVSDRGKGVPQEIASHIFDPFFTTKEIGKGTGLGLWMVQGIVRRHGGWIELVSELGKGSEFKIFLPVWNGSPPETDDEEQMDTAVALAAGRSVTPAQDENGHPPGHGHKRHSGQSKTAA